MLLAYVAVAQQAARPSLTYRGRLAGELRATFLVLLSGLAIGVLLPHHASGWLHAARLDAGHPPCATTVLIFAGDAEPGDDAELGSREHLRSTDTAMLFMGPCPSSILLVRFRTIGRYGGSRCLAFWCWSR